MIASLRRLPIACVSLLLLASPSFCQKTERISIDSAGRQGNLPSGGSSISADARFVVFGSNADNWGEDTNNQPDIFLRDRLLGKTRRVSLGNVTVQANGASSEGQISANGRAALFASDATNLIAGDTNQSPDIFLRCLMGICVGRESLDSSERQVRAPLQGSPSPNANAESIAFVSNSDQLVPGDSWEGADIFVRERMSGLTHLVSVDSDEVQKEADSYQPSISDDGRFIAFVSVGAFVEDDTNGKADIFLRDRFAETTERISLDSSEAQANGPSEKPSVTGNGRFVVFVSAASNLVVGDTNRASDVFLRDRLTGVTERVSVGNVGQQANRASEGASAVSGDGRFVAFQSSATNLLSGDTNGASDIFVRDRLLKRTRRVSVSTSGEQADNASSAPELSFDGRVVTFQSAASNLVSGDTNGAEDIFAHDLGSPPDGRNDLVIDLGQGGVHQFMNNRSWLRTHTASPTSIAVGDFDGDLQNDVVAMFSDGLWGRFNNTESWRKLSGLMVGRMIALDHDGDGIDELLGEVRDRIYVRRFDGRWDTFRAEPTDELAVGDFNGDGREDIVIDTGVQGLWVYSDVVGLGRMQRKMDPADPLRVAGGDLDGDGRDELIADFGGSRGLQARFNEGEDWVTLNTWPVEALIVGDLDGNDREELIADFGSRGIYARYNNAAAWVKLHAKNPVRILAADLDRDGKAELIASFPNLGIWARYNNLNPWRRLNASAEQGMAAGGFD